MNTRDITLAVPALQRAYAYVVEQWPERYPNDPKPFLSQVFRPAAMQQAYYAQGRKGLHEVNLLRATAGLAPITAKENLSKITNAQVGKSKHERMPAEAIDFAFVKKGATRELDYSPRLFAQVNTLIQEVEPGIRWGKHFKNVDSPHFEV